MGWGRGEESKEDIPKETDTLGVLKYLQDVTNMFKALKETLKMKSLRMMFYQTEYQ
jgi:hypothetical protein